MVAAAGNCMAPHICVLGCRTRCDTNSMSIRPGLTDDAVYWSDFEIVHFDCCFGTVRVAEPDCCLAAATICC